VAGVNGDYIEEYLTQLRAALSIVPARAAEIVAEAEDHLRESAAARQADGLGAAAAQRAAIAAFGSVKHVSRAHRPSMADYAAAAALWAWALLGGYLLLTAVLGGVGVWREIVSFGAVVVRGTLNNGLAYWGPAGTPDPAQLAGTLGGCALAGLMVLAGFLVARRRLHHSFAALAPLPSGLFPLAAGIAFLVLAIAQVEHPLDSYAMEWLPVQGVFELIGGSQEATELLGVCCVLRALALLAQAGVQPRPPVVAGLVTGFSGTAPAGKTLLAGEGARAALTGVGPAGAAVRARQVPVSGYVAEAALDAGQWLGSYLLLAALVSGVLLYTEGRAALSQGSSLPWWEALCAGCGLAGALLFTGIQFLRRRGRRGGGALVRVPRWLSLPVGAVWPMIVAVVEYRVFSSNAMGSLDIAEVSRPGLQGIYWLVLGVQFAAVLMALGNVARALAFLVRRVPAGQDNPPGNPGLAPVR
jgi:hypothetical protein